MSAESFEFTEDWERQRMYAWQHSESWLSDVVRRADIVPYELSIYYYDCFSSFFYNVPITSIALDVFGACLSMPL